MNIWPILKTRQNSNITWTKYICCTWDSNPGRRIQCDPIGRFLKVFGRQIFFQKKLKYWVTFGLFLNKNCCDYFWLLFISTSGHTGRIEDLERSIELWRPTNLRHFCLLYVDWDIMIVPSHLDFFLTSDVIGLISIRFNYFSCSWSSHLIWHGKYLKLLNGRSYISRNTWVHSFAINKKWYFALQSVWPGWAIYYTLGNFSKFVATNIWRLLSGHTASNHVKYKITL